MKARIIYLATLMMAMFVMSACSEDKEDMNAYMDNLINNYVYRIVEVTIDGEKADIPGWAISFSEKGTVKDEHNLIYNMFCDYEIGHRGLYFIISATLSGNDVVFSADESFNTPEYKVSVEGKLIKIDTANDILYLDIKRTSSDTPFAGKTYLMELSKDAVDVNDFADNASFNVEGEKIAATDYAREYPLAFYFKCLQKAFGYKTLKLSFLEDNQLSFEGKDEETGLFVPIEDKCRYFLVDSKSGYIEMNMNSTLSNISKNPQNIEEWRNVLCIPFELNFSTDGNVQLSLDYFNIISWATFHYDSRNITKKEYDLYYTTKWWNDFDDKLWLEMTELK